MEGHTDCFVSGTIATVLRVSRCMGIAPLRFEKRGNGWSISAASRSVYAISCLITSVIGLAYLWTTLSQLFSAPNDKISEWGTSQRVVWMVEALGLITMATLMVFCSPIHMRQLINCLSEVEKVNSKLMRIHPRPVKQRNYTKLFISWTVLNFVTILFDYVTVVFLIMNPGPWMKVAQLPYYLYYTVIQMRVLQYCLIVLHVRSSFQAVNDYLRSLQQEFSRHSSLYDEFHCLSSAYGAAVDVVRVVNQSEGPMVLTMLAFLLQHIITTGFYFISIIIYVFVSTDEPAFVIYEVVLFLWTFIHVCNLLMIIEPCHLTHEEMKTTQIVVSRLMRYTYYKRVPLTFKLEKFYKYLAINEVCYKPLNVITMNRGLVLTILASVTTYLVVLLKI